MKRALLAVLLCSVAVCAPAQKVYKWIMPDGSVRFSDRPQEAGAVGGGEIRIHAQEPSGGAGAAAPAPAGQGEQPAAEEPAGFAGYESFEITSPKEGEAIRDNGGNVSIRLALVPSLQPDDVIEVFMDGKSLGTGRTTTITMTEVDRGSHTVQASVRDKSGKQAITTGAVTFSLLRVAAGG